MISYPLAAMLQCIAAEDPYLADILTSAMPGTKIKNDDVPYYIIQIVKAITFANGHPLDKAKWLLALQMALEALQTTTQLQGRIETLEAAIRRHRDQEGDDRCFLDNYELYSILPEGYEVDKLRLQNPISHLANCVRYVLANQDPTQPYYSAQREIDRLRERIKELENK